MTPLLSIDHVAKRYGRRQVLRDVSFSVSRQQAVGLIGPNGAGKTTLLRIALGLQHQDAGRVSVDGGDPRSAAARVAIGYFAGEFTIPTSVRTCAWRRLFHDVGSGDEDRRIADLSRGTRQLLGLRTVFSLPALRLIVLDEPWEGLDPDAARWLSESIRARRASGAAVLVSSHRLHDLADVCDSFVFLDKGTSAVMAPRDTGQGQRPTGESLLDAFDELRAGRR